MKAARRSWKCWIVWAALAACVLGAGWLRYSFVTWREERLRLAVPLEVGIGDALSIDGEMGLFDGCGGAVFELTPATRSRLQAAGLPALSESAATHSRVSGRPLARGWQATPYLAPPGESRGEDFWAYALSCGSIDKELHDMVRLAVDRPGAFFRVLNHAAVVVVPASGVAALVWYD